MRLQVMSDLHLEMHRDAGAEFVQQLEPSGVDVLVLAGDICAAGDYDDLAATFARFARRYPRILYVAGNHEYYKSSPTQVTRNLERLSSAVPSLRILNNDAVVIDGQRFIGGTMWFHRDPMGEVNKRLLSDFSMIDGFEPWVYDQAVAFEKILATKVEEDDVVLTHHLPAPESIDPRHAGSALNAFFLCDMAAHIRDRQPKLWIHGHTHHRADYRIGRTRVVCNPLDYPSELRSLREFDPRFRIDV